MAKEIPFGDGGAGKIRSFGVGLLLTVVTLGVYYWFWYYLVNDELKDIGVSRDDQKLATSSPAMSVAAVTVGGFVFIPPPEPSRTGGRSRPWRGAGRGAGLIRGRPVGAPKSTNTPHAAGE